MTKKIKWLFLALLMLFTATTLTACGKPEDKLAGVWEIHIYGKNREGKKIDWNRALAFTKPYTDGYGYYNGKTIHAGTDITDLKDEDNISKNIRYHLEEGKDGKLILTITKKDSDGHYNVPMSQIKFDKLTSRKATGTYSYQVYSYDKTPHPFTAKKIQKY